MAVTSKKLRLEAPAQQRETRRSVTLRRPQLPQLTFSGQSLLVVLALVALLLVGPLGSWSRTMLDDFRYGRPRTHTVAAFVGHEGTSQRPTQFVAMNLNRQIVVIEFPGGDASQARTIIGPYLFGQGEDLRPVTLQIEDANRDNLPDLLVMINNEVLVYLNHDGGFRMLTPEEYGQVEIR